jgi:hypothetical protein
MEDGMVSMVRQILLTASITMLLAGLLAGCETAIVEELPGPRGEDAIVQLDQATRRGAILTTVIGNPFQGDKKAFDAQVLRQMRGQNRGKPAAFVAVPDRRTDPSYKVTVVFNAVAGVTSGALCRDRGGITSRPYTGALTMSIALCRGEDALSGAAARVTDLKGPGDSKFATLVGTATRVMVQPKVPDLPQYPHYDGQYTQHDDNDGD